MEIIRIPQVSLVDGTGRKIGVYSEDPDWWQQLKLKQRNKNLLQIASHQHLKIENERKQSPVESIEMNCSTGTGNSKVRLIEEEDNNKQKKNIKMTVIDASSNNANDSGIQY